MNKDKKKKKKWLKFRHKVVRNLLGWTLGIYSKIRYNIKIEKFKQPKKGPYLILLNHQTAFDQFFVGLAFKQPVNVDIDCSIGRVISFSTASGLAPGSVVTMIT